MDQSDEAAQKGACRLCIDVAILCKWNKVIEQYSDLTSVSIFHYSEGITLMNFVCKALSVVLLSVVPSLSMGEIYRCSTGVTDQEMERKYAKGFSEKYLSGDAIIGLEGNKLSFVSFETAYVAWGVLDKLDGKTNLQCDTDYSLSSTTLECWDNQKNDADYDSLVDSDYKFEIVEIDSTENNFASLQDIISAIKRGKEIDLNYSWFIFDIDERGLPNYVGINDAFFGLKCR